MGFSLGFQVLAGGRVWDLLMRISIRSRDDNEKRVCPVMLFSCV